MATKQLQIGTDIFNMPNAGEGAGWGEEVTDYLEAVANALSTVQNAGDILPTAVSIANNVTSVANIPGLLFDTSQVVSIEVDYFIRRTYDSGATTTMEEGKIKGFYDGSDFQIAHERRGNSGVTLSVTSAGQFQYISSNLANYTSGTIVFKAKTILEP